MTLRRVRRDRRCRPPAERRWTTLRGGRGPVGLGVRRRPARRRRRRRSPSSTTAASAAACSTNLGLIDGLQAFLGEGVTSFGGGNIILGGARQRHHRGPRRRRPDRRRQVAQRAHQRAPTPNDHSVEIRSVDSMKELVPDMLVGRDQPGPARDRARDPGQRRLRTTTPRCSATCARTTPSPRRRTAPPPSPITSPAATARTASPTSSGCSSPTRRSTCPAAWANARARRPADASWTRRASPPARRRPGSCCASRRRASPTRTTPRRPAPSPARSLMSGRSSSRPAPASSPTSRPTLRARPPRASGQTFTVTPDLAGLSIRAMAIYADQRGVLETVFSAPTRPRWSTRARRPAPAPAVHDLSVTDERHGFQLIRSDLDFILDQIRISERHAAGEDLARHAAELARALRPAHRQRRVQQPGAGQTGFGAADNAVPAPHRPGLPRRGRQPDACRATTRRRTRRPAATCSTPTRAPSRT